MAAAHLLLELLQRPIRPQLLHEGHGGHDDDGQRYDHSVVQLPHGHRHGRRSQQQQDEGLLELGGGWGLSKVRLGRVRLGYLRRGGESCRVGVGQTISVQQGRERAPLQSP